MPVVTTPGQPSWPALISRAMLLIASKDAEKGDGPLSPKCLAVLDTLRGMRDEPDPEAFTGPGDPLFKSYRSYRKNADQWQPDKGPRGGNRWRRGSVVRYFPDGVNPNQTGATDRASRNAVRGAAKAERQKLTADAAHAQLADVFASGEVPEDAPDRVHAVLSGMYRDEVRKLGVLLGTSQTGAMKDLVAKVAEAAVGRAKAGGWKRTEEAAPVIQPTAATPPVPPVDHVAAAAAMHQEAKDQLATYEQAYTAAGGTPDAHQQALKASGLTGEGLRHARKVAGKFGTKDPGIATARAGADVPQEGSRRENGDVFVQGLWYPPSKPVMASGLPESARPKPYQDAPAATAPVSTPITPPLGAKPADVAALRQAMGETGAKEGDRNERGEVLRGGRWHQDREEEAAPEVTALPEQPEPAAEDDVHPLSREIPPAQSMAPGVSVNDIPYQAAYAAHNNTSFVPERRARQRQNEYVEQMNADWQHLSRYAKTPEQQDQLRAEFARYKDGYRQHKLSVLAAASRTASSMITGPSRFPVERNRKRLETEMRRIDELVEYRKRAMRAIQQKLAPETGAIQSNNPQATDLLQKQLTQTQALQERMKQVNAFLRNKVKAERAGGYSGPMQVTYAGKHTYESLHSGLVGMGVSEKQASELLTPDYMGRIGYPDYAIKNNGANIRRIQGRIEELQKLKDSPHKETEYSGGVTVVEDPEAARIRIQFPGKPDRTTIDKLKAGGFRWSPSEGAWQRHLNSGGRNAVGQMLSSLGHTRIEEPEEPAAEDVPPLLVEMTAEDDLPDDTTTKRYPRPACPSSWRHRYHA